MTRIPFLSLRPAEDRPLIDEAITRVLDRGWFILGPELESFEQELAEASGTAAAVGVATGSRDFVPCACLGGRWAPELALGARIMGIPGVWGG